MNLQQSNQTEEFHLVTPSGVVSLITNDIQLALARWERMDQPKNWKILSVVTHRYDVTPARMTRRTTKSAVVTKIARDRGEAVIDVPLVMVA